MGKPEEAEVEVSRLPPGSSVSLTILDSIERCSLYPPIPFTGEIPTNLAPKDRAALHNGDVGLMKRLETFVQPYTLIRQGIPEVQGDPTPWISCC